MALAVILGILRFREFILWWPSVSGKGAPFNVRFCKQAGSLAERGGKERFFIACIPVSPPLPWRDAVVGRGRASALESVVQVPSLAP